LKAALARTSASIADVQLESHLEECAACRAELERLAAAPAWWESAHSYLSDHDLSAGADSCWRNAATDVDTHRFDEHAKADTHRRKSNAEGAKLLSSLPSGLLQPSGEANSLGRIGNYEVVEAIGRGGMGVVVKAFDPALNRFVAIKVLAAEFAHNASARRRFAREAQAAAAVVHDHVVPIFAVDGTGPNPYLVMAYIPGLSLQERIDESGPLEVREILRIGMQTAAGLAAAHAQGLVHRDIKPANILLENGVERVRITDFGLARAMDEASQTQSGVLAGTPQYMAPEQASGEAIDHRTDLFSLGSLLYAMCTGHSPFRAETTVAVLRRICDGAHRPVREVNPDIPHWLAAIIDKLLAKRVADRYGSAEEVARHLAEHLAEVQNPRPMVTWNGRRILAWLAIVVSAACLCLLVVALVNLDGPSAGTEQNKTKSTAATSSSESSSGKAAAVTKPTTPDNIMVIDRELEALRGELRRLETAPFGGEAPVRRPDPLGGLHSTLEALENDQTINRTAR
jgi:serine/threonine-protein kinase